jgi:hypothetical protein
MAKHALRLLDFTYTAKLGNAMGLDMSRPFHTPAVFIPSVQSPPAAAELRPTDNTHCRHVTGPVDWFKFLMAPDAEEPDKQAIVATPSFGYALYLAKAANVFRPDDIPVIAGVSFKWLVSEMSQSDETVHQTDDGQIVKTWPYRDKGIRPESHTDWVAIQFDHARNGVLTSKDLTEYVEDYCWDDMPNTAMEEILSHSPEEWLQKQLTDMYIGDPLL